MSVARVTIWCPIYLHEYTPTPVVRRMRRTLGHGGDRLFFFSSRRRHTRCSRDWSSDVCSSDLAASALVGNRRLNVDALILNSASPRDAYFELFVQRDTFAHKIVFAPELPWRQRQLRAKLVFEHVTRAKPFHCDMFFPKITVERRLTRDL